MLMLKYGLKEKLMPTEEEDNNLNHLEYEGLSPLAQDAANMHEMFVALEQAGFTERQALQLVAFLIDRSDEDNDVNIYINDEMVKKINDAAKEKDEDEDEDED